MSAGVRFDVCIVGAGPAGAAAAIVLARGGARVVIADRAVFPREKVCGDGVLPDAIAVMDELGVPPRPPLAARSPGLAMRTASGREVRFDVPGVVIRRRDLDQALLDAAIAAGAEFLAGHTLAELRDEGGVGCRVGLSAEGRTVRAEAAAVLVATGAAPGPARLAGLAPRSRPGAALRGYAAVSGRSPDTLLIALLSELRRGYAWAFPGPGGVWNVGAGVFAGARGTPRLGQALERFLASLGGRWLERPRGAPLLTGFGCSPFVRGRVALVGEAAGLTRPFSGEGIGPSVRSGVVAGTCLLAQGGGAGLLDYQRRLITEYRRDFRAWRFGERLLAHPALVDRIVARAVKFPGALGRCAGVLGGTNPAARVLSPVGLLRLLVGR
ncbi:MAG: NAD(P)/FAD-dependent oxidoreductase [Acidobacteriota bacterium]